jgi:DNA-3-methyladenine glycosylase I
MKKNINITRCSWCSDDPVYQDYHDTEWGVPEYDDNKLFELLLLEGAQAGLSWITILKKRENYRRAFDNFDAIKMAKYTAEKQATILKDTGIVRNKLKVAAFTKNAIAYLKIQASGTTFSDFLWQFTDYNVQQNSWKTLSEVPVVTPEAEAMSQALKRAGFSFVGPVICYAFMQAAGMVNDHTTDCFRYKEVQQGETK